MKSAIVIVMTIIMSTGVLYGEAMGQAPPIPVEEQPEVLTSGPVNEAFAQPVNLENQAGLTVPTAPPADIEEIPPPERPAGDQFVWVPGYWAWDSDRNGYIWVSGCWRAAPPNMYWMPGYWTQTVGGWRWVPGLWVPVDNREIEYLPAPPALTHVEPPGPAPLPDTIWVPPCWYWQQGQYIYRAGYWIVPQPNWVWVPSHYVRTPRGYVFARGYWDYTLHRRGVLFAPLYFPRHIHRRSRLSYRLSIAVDIGNLEFILFTRPRYSHYYFGDYYDSAYRRTGIFPWFESKQRHRWYDPIYRHARWRHHKKKPLWELHKRQEYDRRQADKTLRPPRTYREMKNRVKHMPESQRSTFEIAKPVTRIVSRKITTFKFEHAEPKARRQTTRHADEVHEFGKQRSNWESRDEGRGTGRTVIKRVPVPKVKKTTESVQPKRSTRKPAEPRQAVPAERADRVKGSGEVWKGATSSPGRQGKTIFSRRETKKNQTDRVKVRVSPVVGKQTGKSKRGKPPSQPDEEQKILNFDRKKARR